MAVYRLSQMAELDELAARGVLAEPERRGVAVETGRRLLAAAETPGGASPRRLAGCGPDAWPALAPLAALAIYVLIGAPAAARTSRSPGGSRPGPIRPWSSFRRRSWPP